jgi:hypothetical protein
MAELLDLIEANLKPDDWRKRKRGERADDGENAEASGSGISNGLVNGNGNDHIHPNVAADGTAIIDDSHVQAYEMQQQAGIPLNGVETEEAIISAAMVEMVAQQVVG